MKRFVLICLVLSLFIPMSLFAQDDDRDMKLGLTFPDIGVIWNISDHVSLLPGFDFGHGWGHSEISNVTNSNDSVSLYAKLRFYISDWNKVRFYLSPKYKYSWLQSDSEINQSTNSFSTHNHTVAGAWGIQYAVSDRISIFGDMSQTVFLLWENGG
jgi:hypothetical protein